MKRLLSVLFACSLLLTLISACAGNETPVITSDPTPTTGAETTQNPDPEPDPEREIKNLTIVSTIFPQYDWVREILGDHADHMDLNLLISSTIDLHNFQPSVSDIATIATADLFICVGGDSDDWVEAALRQSTNPDKIIINLLEVLGDGVKTEELIEGMQHDHDACEDEEECDDDDHGHSHGHSHSHSHGHSHDHDDDEDCEDEDECDDETHDHDHDDHDDRDDRDHDNHHHGDADEHVWLSLNNAVLFSRHIASAIKTLDPENADIYEENLERYIEKLLDLNEEFAVTIDNLSGNTLLFADRFPFRYLVDEYNLHYYAAFSGCSAETEASFATIIFLAGKLDEYDLDTVMVTESGNHAIAETVISSSSRGDQQILILDSMQSVTLNDIRNGITFLSIMESNLHVLKDALS